MEPRRPVAGLALSAIFTLAPIAAGGCGARSELLLPLASEDAPTSEDAVSPGADSATADATLLDATSDSDSSDSPFDAGGPDVDRVETSTCPPESAEPGIAAWAAGFGESMPFPPQSFFNPYGIAVDPQGNVVVVGSFTGVLDVGGTTLSSVPSPTNYNGVVGDVFVLKFDPTGRAIFGKAFGDRNGYDGANGVAVDQAGNIYVAGWFQSTIDFGGGPLSTGASGPAYNLYNAFVVKLDANGNHVWSKAFGDSTKGAEGTALAVDGQGAVLIAGFFGGTLDFGPGGRQTSVGVLALPRMLSGDAFLARLSPAGVPLWSRSFGATGASQLPTSLLTTPSGDIVMAGGFEGSFALSEDAGSGTLVSSASCGPGDFTYDGFLARFDRNGNPLWGRALVGDDTSFVTNIALDSAGEVIATGNFNGSLDITGGAGTVPTDAGVLRPGLEGGPGCVDAFYLARPWNRFIAKFDGSGARLWGYGLGTANAVGAYVQVPLAIDGMDNVYVAPIICGSVSLPTADGGTLGVEAGTCFRVGGYFYGSIARLDTSGYAHWFRSYGDPHPSSSTVPGGLAVGACPSDLYLTGDFAGQTRFDGPDGSIVLDGGGAPNNPNAPTWALFVARLGQ
jgi:hypothetical protein